MDNYYNKYFKYKRKYIHLKNKYIGGGAEEFKLEEIIKIVTKDKNDMSEEDGEKIINILKEGWEKSGWTLQIADQDAKIKEI